jgi:Zn-dependent protease
MFDIAADELICRVFTLVIAFTVHEFAHAWVADYFGDYTARAAGRLTLNPLVHLDIFGSLLLIVAGFGWARAVPINPDLLRQRSRFGVLWVSLAGPVSNLVLAAISGIIIRLGLVDLTLPTGMLPTLGEFLYVFCYINILLAIFNLIPLPPLDGEKILSGLLPESAQQTLAKFRPVASMVLFGLIIFGSRVGLDVFDWILTPAADALSLIFAGV